MTARRAIGIGVALGGAVGFLTHLATPTRRIAQLPPGAARKPPEREAPDDRLYLTWGTVSPGGHFVLAHFSMPEDALDPLQCVVNWDTGKTGIWRRIPSGPILAWSPSGDKVVRRELLPKESGLGKPEEEALVCRRIPDLSEVWRVLPSHGYAVWTPDGEQLITTSGSRKAKVWDLIVVSRTGARRVIARNGDWVPVRVVLVGREPAIVCRSDAERPAPLTLLRMDGSVIAQVGPALPRGSYFVSPHLDRFAWRSYDDPTDEYLLATHTGDTWEMILVQAPPAPQWCRSSLLEAGAGNLLIYNFSWTFWAVDWSGRLRKLQRPRSQGNQPFPWVDDHHLIRAVNNHLELIDGNAGRIERKVPVTFPGWVANHRPNRAEPRPARLAHAHLRGADLRGRKLEGADLRGADLRGARLSGAFLYRARLQAVNLTGADLTRVELAEATLKNARLIGARLIKSGLSNANLNHADLSRARLAGAHLTEADLSYASLREADLKGAELGSAKLKRTDLRGADLRGAKLATDLAEARIDGATRLDPKWRLVRYLQAFGGRRRDLRAAQLAEAYLGRARLRGANLAGANLDAAVLDSADLRDANLKGASLTGRPSWAATSLRRTLLARADLTRANLQRAALEETNLTGARLQHARLQNAWLAGARLHGAQLQGAQLQGALFNAPPGAGLGPANLQGADLTGAYYDNKTCWPPGYDPRRHGAIGLLPGADLHGQDLRGIELTADLTGVILRGANLRTEDLRWARLASADLSGTDLEGASLQAADLRSANLEGAKLGGADFTGARYDAHTRWPDGFDPQPHGAILVK